MEEINNIMQEIIEFFTGIKKESWRDVVISSFLIPLVFYLVTKLRIWQVSLRPLNLVLKGYRKSNKDILIYLSQLSAAEYQNEELQLKNNPIYLIRHPNPRPQDHANLEKVLRCNIDPVWAQSDGQCAAEVFNLLGRINKFEGFRIANTIKDWNKQLNPIFSIGFNPKTEQLMETCTPINFQIKVINSLSELSINGHDITLGAYFNLEGGIIQKTFIGSTKVPVIILAGLGTTSTEAAGKVLNENCIAFGKLYGSSSFCVLIETAITIGSDYNKIIGIFPQPKLYRAFWYPITYIKWHRKKVSPLRKVS